MTEQGVTKDKILLGASIALKGPLGPEGIKVVQGNQLHLDRVNRAGGIHGRKLEFRALDDQFTPAKSVANTEQLLTGEYAVFAILAPFGTPNVLATLPLIRKNGIIEFAPIAVADTSRNPVIKNVFNLREGALAETRA